MSAVVLAEKHSGMKVDYRGMLHSAQVALRYGKVSQGSAFLLEEFERHLTELGERYYSGDVSVVDEFLQLYCINKDGRERVSS